MPAFLQLISGVNQLLERAAEKSRTIRGIGKEHAHEDIGGRLPDRFAIGSLLQHLGMLVARGPSSVPFPGFVWRRG